MSRAHSPRTPPPADPLRRKLLLALPGGLMLGTPVALIGCGGNDADGEEPRADGVKGAVVLPPGVRMQDVTLVSGAEEVRPADDGRYSVAQAGSALALLSVVHGSDKLLGLALAAPGDTALAVDAQSAAAALLFLAVGGTGLEDADARRVLAAVKAHDQTRRVATVIKARADADPFALDGPDDAIVAAVMQAVAALRAGAAPATAALRARLAAATDVQPLLLIEPGGEVNGIAVNQDGDTPAFSITNNKRRSGYAHVYKVAYQMPEAALVELPQPEPVGDLIRVPTTLAMSIAAVPGAFLAGGVPWEPKTTSRVPLPMHEGAERTVFEVVYLTTVWDRPEPDFFTTGRFATHAALWRDEIEGLNQTAVMQFLFGAILAGLGIGSAAIEELAFAEAVAALEAVAASDGNLLALMQQARGGVQLLPTVRAWLQLMAGSGEGIALVNERVLPAVAGLVRRANAQLAANMVARSVSRARLVAFRGVMRVLVFTWAVLGVIDTGAQWKDLHDGEKGSLFSATLVAPTVFVTPSSGTVGKGQEQVLTARLSGAQGVTLTYRWTLTGSNLANLSDKAGKIGTTIDTDRASVTLATTPSTVGTLTITVEAFQVKPAGNLSLGTATSQLVMDDSSAALTPASARIERVGGSQVFTMSVTPTPVEAMSYEWTCPSQWGALTSGGASTSAAQQTITSTQATATYAGRANLDGGESEGLNCVAKVMREDPATGVPQVVVVGNARADVSIRQKFNIELVSLPAEVPADNAFAVVARITDPVPAGATIEWSWLHSGVGAITTSPADADKPNSSVQFNSGSGDGQAMFTVSARVTVSGQPMVPVLPVTRSTSVKKGLRQIVFEANGGVFGCTDPLACGVTEYTAFVVPRFAKATLYSATLSGYAFAGCNRSVSWNSVVGDGGGCNFPVTYFPHSSVQPTNAWAVWIGFGGPISGKCVVTVTLSA